MTWSAGDTAAKEHPAAKTPGLIVSPATLPAGSRARFAIVGFPNNSTIRVSVTGPPEFHGDHRQRRLHVGHVHPALRQERHHGGAGGRLRTEPRTANGTLTIRGFNDNRVPIVKVQGDNQTGPPGALLPLDSADCVARCRRRPGGGRRGDLPGLQRGAAFHRRRGHRCQWPGRDLGSPAKRRRRHPGARRCARGGIRPGDFRTPARRPPRLPISRHSSKAAIPNSATDRRRSRKKARY